MSTAVPSTDESPEHSSQPSPKRVISLPQITQERLEASLDDVPIDTEKFARTASFSPEKQKTILYLAYGSNLCNETFRGSRGIRPLSQVNTLVPSLRLTFDLPGVPYSEPCFANTAHRSPNANERSTKNNDDTRGSSYHKNRWSKGLVGVVYEVTLSDYAHIIATEGGGSAYQDILVDCFVLPKGDTVPSTPASRPFKAHTLFAPRLNQDGTKCSAERATRPDPNYAQPSARYLKLITDGAAECELPGEYREYLDSIRAYTITTRMQAIGKAVFLTIWMPWVMLVLTLSRKLQDKRGKAPKWFAWFGSLVFKTMWLSYDRAFKDVFGDGERTMSDEGTVGETYVDADKEGLLEEAARTLDANVGQDKEREAGRL